MIRSIRLRKRWWILALATAILGSAIWWGPRFVRREVSRQIAEWTASPVEIDALSVGWHWQEVRQIRLLDPASRKPWLTIARARVELPLWEALRGRRTAGQVVLDQPSIVLHFDQHGNLLTPLPSAEDTGTDRLPFESAAFRQVRVEVRQPERETLVIDQICGEITQESNRLRAELQDGQALGAQWTGEADIYLHERVLQGQLTAREVTLHSEQLRKLALVPAWPESDMIAAGKANVHATVEMTDSEIRQYELRLAMTALTIHSDRQGNLLRDGCADVRVENGRLTLTDSSASLFGGTAKLLGQVDLHAPWPTEPIQLQLRNIDLQQASSVLPTNERMHGLVSADGEVRITQCADGFALVGKAAGQVNEADVSGVAFDALSFELGLDEFLLPRANQSASAQGLLAVRFQTQLLDLPATITQISDGNVGLPNELNGSAILRGNLRIPLETIDHPDSYTATIDVEAPLLTLADFRTRNGKIHAEYKEGRLKGQSIALDLEPQGRIEGRFEVDLMDKGELIADLRAERLPLNRLANDFEARIHRLEGEVSAECHVQVPTKDWEDLKQWRVNGSLQCPQIRLNDFEATNLSTQLHLTDGMLQVEACELRYQTATLAGHGTLRLQPPYRFDGQVQVPPVGLNAVLSGAPIDMPYSVDGSATGQAKVAGTLTPWDWQAKGEARIESLRVADWAVDQVTVTWELDEDRVRLDSVIARVKDSTIEATGTIPWNRRDRVTIDGTFRNLPVPAIPEASREMPIHLTGTVSGRFRIEQPTVPTERSVGIEFRGGRANAAGVDFDHLAGRALWKDERLQMKFAGQTLGGNVLVTARGSLLEQPIRLEGLTGNVRLQNVQLSALSSALDQRDRWGNLQGEGSMELQVDLSAEETGPRAHGSLQMADIRLGSKRLTRKLTSNVEISPDGWKLLDARSQIAQGQIVAQLRGKRGNAPIEFQFRGTGLSATSLFTFWPKAQRMVSGTVDAEFQGTLADRCQGQGTVRISRARFARVPVSQVNIPAAWTVWPQSGAVTRGSMPISGSRRPVEPRRPATLRGVND